jgi:hypothetical protein
MSVGFTSTNPEDVRRRFQAMDDDELLRTGKSAAFLCSPEANHGRPPSDAFIIQLREARAEWKRRHAHPFKSDSGLERIPLARGDSQ